jgi:Phage integrase SAM-like domain
MTYEACSDTEASYMAWIVVVPPSARHPQVRFQVCYQEGKRHRSAGIFLTERRALAEKRALERRQREQAPVPAELDLERARTLFGEYVTSKWWPAWKDQHPASEYGTRKKVEKRILPTFGDLPLGELDPSTIGKWKAAMVAEGLTARTVNTYLSLLGTILNAAVDDDYLTRSPLVRKSGAGRTAATRNQPVPRREVWLLRDQLDRLAAAIDSRYRALVLVAALTGLRWGELIALRWDDPASTSPWTTAPCWGRGGFALPGPSATPDEPATESRRPPRPKPASGTSPSTRRPSRRSWPTESWSAAAPTTASSPARAALGVLLRPWCTATSSACGSGPWSRPSWPTCGPSTVGCTSTTCGTPMPPG